MEKKKSIFPKSEILFLGTILSIGLILIAGVLIFFPLKKTSSPPSSMEEKGVLPSPEIEKSEELQIFQDFTQAISQLNTPQKLIDYLNQNFVLENKESDFSQNPEEFLKTKKGNRADIATFCSFVLFQNGYFSTIFRYKFLDEKGDPKIRTLTLFTEADKAKIIDLENSKLKILPAGNALPEFLEDLEKTHNVKITEYTAFTFGTQDFTKGDWLPR